MTATAPLCFIDTETDGVHPKREAWEVALIRRDYDPADSTSFNQTEVQFFVDVDLAKADPFGLKVGGFYERHPMGRWLASRPESAENPWPPRHLYDELLTPGQAARTIARMTHGAHLVGVVPNFDAEVFDRLLRRNGLLPGWHYHLVDVEAMAVGWLNAWYGRPRRWVLGAQESYAEPVELSPSTLITLPDAEVQVGGFDPAILTPPWRSDDLARAGGVEPPSEEDRHTALGDARWAMRWYDTLTGGGSDA